MGKAGGAVTGSPTGGEYAPSPLLESLWWIKQTAGNVSSNWTNNLCLSSVGWINDWFDGSHWRRALSITAALRCVNMEIWDCTISICQAMDFSCIKREYRRGSGDAGQFEHGGMWWGAGHEGLPLLGASPWCMQSLSQVNHPSASANDCSSAEFLCGFFFF